jgi:hypothetical protein
MTRLILTSSSGAGLMRSGLAEVVITVTFRFVWGPLPSKNELVTYVGSRSDLHGPGSHWSDFTGRWQGDSGSRKDLGLVEFCQPYESVELWFDPNPNDQLQLIWLLDCFRSHPEAAARLRLRLVDFDLISQEGEELGEWKVPEVAVAEAELDTACRSWQSYRATTPEACFRLLRSDLSALPLLRPALVDLLEELPSGATGLSATEMRLLELIARGYERPNALFHLRTLRRRDVFGEFEIGYLLDGLAHGPRPAVAGLDDELRTLGRENYRARDAAYKRSRLSLTEFGKSILAHREDFSRHDAIDRWWGGTRLTNDRLWCWDPVLTEPVKRWRT